MLDYLFFGFLSSIIINYCAFTIAFSKQTDTLTDITYSATFIVLALFGFYHSEKGTVDMITLFVIVVWAIRLGAYLLLRVNKMGRDTRFDKMRPVFFRFLFFWTLQALSIFIISLPFLIVFYSSAKSPSMMFYILICLSVFGLALESLADYQKSKFKQEQPNTFVNRGLWKKIRHPNYLGEILVWLGIGLSGVLFAPHIAYISLLSPLWIIILLTKISGIPFLQRAWDKKYGDMESFKKYMKNSWKLIPYVY